MAYLSANVNKMTNWDHKNDLFVTKKRNTLHNILYLPHLREADMKKIYNFNNCRMHAAYS